MPTSGALTMTRSRSPPGDEVEVAHRPHPPVDVRDLIDERGLVVAGDGAGCRDRLVHGCRWGIGIAAEDHPHTGVEAHGADPQVAIGPPLAVQRHDGPGDIGVRHDAGW
jgi:hypothetical protein